MGLFHEEISCALFLESLEMLKNIILFSYKKSHYFSSSLSTSPQVPTINIGLNIFLLILFFDMSSSVFSM